MITLESRIFTAIRAISATHGFDVAIAELAQRQHGVIGRMQLLALGMSPGAIQRRIDAGRLHVVFAGVYAVGHRRLSREGRWIAAVLAGGNEAQLSDASAAALHGFAADDRAAVHVTTKGRHESRNGLRFHERALTGRESTTKHGIPVTTPARTLLDLATTANPQALERALREALFQHATSLPALRRLLRAHRGDRGARALRGAIQKTEDAPGRLRSGPEQRFLTYLRKHGLPFPELNVYMRIGDLEIEADCVWREHRLIAELDHRGTHANRKAFESDRRRDRTLQAFRWRAVRITEPYDAGLHADVTALLAAAVHDARNPSTREQASAGT